MRTSSPLLCTCTRAPSSFHSSAAMGMRAIASVMSSAGCASIGASGWKSAMAKRLRPAAPSASASDATLTIPPAIIAARRTFAAGKSAAAATASIMRPSSAPWRNSPSSSRARNSCSRVVALAKSADRMRVRSAIEPRPLARAICSSVVSTSVRVSSEISTFAAGCASRIRA